MVMYRKKLIFLIVPYIKLSLNVLIEKVNIEINENQIYNIRICLLSFFESSLLILDYHIDVRSVSSPP